MQGRRPSRRGACPSERQPEPPLSPPLLQPGPAPPRTRGHQLQNQHRVGHGAAVPGRVPGHRARAHAASGSRRRAWAGETAARTLLAGVGLSGLRSRQGPGRPRARWPLTSETGEEARKPPDPGRSYCDFGQNTSPASASSGNRTTSAVGGTVRTGTGPFESRMPLRPPFSFGAGGRGLGGN